MGFTRTGAFYYGLSTGMPDVYIATLDPVTGRVVTAPAPVSQQFQGRGSSPAWSPDGRFVAYLSNRRAVANLVRGPRVICIRSLETGEERQVSTPLSFEVFHRLHWSPDGRFLLEWPPRGRSTAPPPTRERARSSPRASRLAASSGGAGWPGGPGPVGLLASYFKYVVFKNPDWDFRTYDFNRDVARADSEVGATLNAIDPDLKAFVKRGGKLLLYHGWSDPLITPHNTVNYYESVKTVLGAPEAESAVRLFMAPGMNHCAGGPGPNTIDWIAALERWVEQGQAPDEIVASRSVKGVVDRTRPLCRYPHVARYKGSGSTDEAANFVCTTP